MYAHHLPKHVDGNLEFRRKSRWTKLIFISLFVLLPAYSCLAFAYFHFTTPSGQLLPIGGAIMLLAVPLWVIKSALPVKIVFHNGHKRVYLLETEDQLLSQAASFPFNDFETFSVKRKTDQHASNEGARASVSWDVALENRDGSLWALCNFRDQGEAELVAKQCEASILRGSDWRGDTSLYSSDRFRVYQEGASAQVEWTVKRLARHRTGLWLILGGAIAVVMGSFSPGSEYGPLGLITFLIGSILVWAIIKTPPKRTIRITTTEFYLAPMWSIFSRLSSSEPEALPIETLHALNFDLHNAHHISVIRKDEQDYFSKLQTQELFTAFEGQQNPMPQIRQIFGRLANIKRIDCVGLTSSEVLELKYLLRDQIHRLSGLHIL